MSILEIVYLCPSIYIEIAAYSYSLSFHLLIIVTIITLLGFKIHILRPIVLEYLEFYVNINLIFLYALIKYFIHRPYFLITFIN